MKKNKTIIILSSHKDTGNTTTIVNLASAIADKGLKTLIISCYQVKNNLTTLLGIYEEHNLGLSDILDGNTELKDTILISKTNRNLHTIQNSNEYDINKLQPFLNDISSKYSYIFLDVPSDQIDKYNISINNSTDILFLAMANVSSVRDTGKLIKKVDILLKTNNNINQKLIINKLDVTSNEDTSIDVAAIHEILSLDILGVIPNEKNLDSFITINNPVFNDKEIEISHSYDRISNRIINKTTLNTLEFNILEKLQDGKISKFLNKFFKIG